MRKFLGIVAVAGAILTLAGTAQARTAQPAEQLRLEEHDTGTAGWQRHVSDSPADSGHQRVKLAVAEQTGNDYVVVVAPRSGVRGPIDEVGHLGFDVLTRTYIGAGAPRISVGIDTDGDQRGRLPRVPFGTVLPADLHRQRLGAGELHRPEVGRVRASTRARLASPRYDEHGHDERMERLRRGTLRRRGPERVHGAGRGRTDLRRPDRDRAPHVPEREPGGGAGLTADPPAAPGPGVSTHPGASALPCP